MAADRGRTGCPVKWVENELAWCKGAWEIPQVITVKADDRQRVRLPDVPPGKVFAVEQNSDGSITLREVRPIESAPVVNPVLKDGVLMWPVKVSRQAIRVAIRKDRDEK